MAHYSDSHSAVASTTSLPYAIILRALSTVYALEAQHIQIFPRASVHTAVRRKEFIAILTLHWHYLLRVVTDLMPVWVFGKEELLSVQ
jgi:hypothetical protein